MTDPAVSVPLSTEDLALALRWLDERADTDAVSAATAKGIVGTLMARFPQSERDA